MGASTGARGCNNCSGACASCCNNCAPSISEVQRAQMESSRMEAMLRRRQAIEKLCPPPYSPYLHQSFNNEKAQPQAPASCQPASTAPATREAHQPRLQSARAIPASGSLAPYSRQMTHQIMPPVANNDQPQALHGSVVPGFSSLASAKGFKPPRKALTPRDHERAH